MLTISNFMTSPGLRCGAAGARPSGICGTHTFSRTSPNGCAMQTRWLRYPREPPRGKRSVSRVQDKGCGGCLDGRGVEHHAARSTEDVRGKVRGELGLDNTRVAVGASDTAPDDADTRAVDLTLGLVNVGDTLRMLAGEAGRHVGTEASVQQLGWQGQRQHYGLRINTFFLLLGICAARHTVDADPFQRPFFLAFRS